MGVRRKLAHLVAALGIRQRDSEFDQRHPEGRTGRAPVDENHIADLDRRASGLGRKLR